MRRGKCQNEKYVGGRESWLYERVIEVKLRWLRLKKSDRVDARPQIAKVFQKSPGEPGDILKTMHLFSRGNKAENAAKFGCAALIIFSDPAEAAQEGTEPEHVYPESFWLPGTGVQRGSLALADGDPLTPNWPSVDHAYRLDSEERQVRSAEKTRKPFPSC